VARQQSYARRKPVAQRLAAVEAEIEVLAGEKKELEDWLARPEAYDAGHRELLKERLARQGDLDWQLARLEAEWLELSEALEGLDGG
jgi:ATP-binding cassette subfamily F protein 3